MKPGDQFGIEAGLAGAGDGGGNVMEFFQHGHRVFAVVADAASAFRHQIETRRPAYIAFEGTAQIEKQLSPIGFWARPLDVRIQKQRVGVAGLLEAMLDLDRIDENPAAARLDRRIEVSTPRGAPQPWDEFGDESEGGGIG